MEGNLLDDGNVYRSGSARDVDPGVGHCDDIIIMVKRGEEEEEGEFCFFGDGRSVRRGVVRQASEKASRTAAGLFLFSPEKPGREVGVSEGLRQRREIVSRVIYRWGGGEERPSDSR